jgi:hypothetical protein
MTTLSQTDFGLYHRRAPPLSQPWISSYGAEQDNEDKRRVLLLLRLAYTQAQALLATNIAQEPHRLKPLVKYYLFRLPFCLTIRFHLLPR